MSSFSNFLFGGGADLYENPYKGAIDSDINQLRNSNIGALTAQSAESKISRRLAERTRMMRNTPGFGRNAAVMSKLSNQAAEEADGATVDANIAGANLDVNNRVKAAQLSQNQSQMDFAISQENEQRKDAASFGNSFFGGLLNSAVSVGAGALTGGLTNMIASGGGGGDDSGGGGGGGNTGSWTPSNIFG